VRRLKSLGQWPWRWTSFAMVYTAAGPNEGASQFPVFGIGKRLPDRSPGLLVPNPFFVSPEWWDRYLNESFAASEERPWHNRSAKVLFRGACGPGADARVALMMLEEDRLDVGFTKADGFPDVRKCVAALLAKRNATTDLDAFVSKSVKSHVPQSNFSSYRVLLHMPGSASGSYSRNLQHLFAHGAIVLIWKHAAVEWYYQYLKPGRHYLSVDETNLHRTLDRLEANHHLQRILRRGAHHFADDYLAGRNLVDRWRAIFAELAARQPNSTDTFDAWDATEKTVEYVTRRGNTRSKIVTLPRPCTCEGDGESLVPCQKCSITALKGRRMAKFVGISSHS